MENSDEAGGKTQDRGMVGKVTGAAREFRPSGSNLSDVGFI
jgi:hypothetical protein